MSAKGISTTVKANDEDDEEPLALVIGIDYLATADVYFTLAKREPFADEAGEPIRRFYIPNEQALQAARFIARETAGDPWSNDDIYPPSDWVCEVGNGDTRLSYREWVEQKRESGE